MPNVTAQLCMRPRPAHDVTQRQSMKYLNGSPASYSDYRLPSGPFRKGDAIALMASKRKRHVTAWDEPARQYLRDNRSWNTLQCRKGLEGLGYRYTETAIRNEWQRLGIKKRQRATKLSSRTGNQDSERSWSYETSQMQVTQHIGDCEQISTEAIRSDPWSPFHRWPDEVKRPQQQRLDMTPEGGQSTSA